MLNLTSRCAAALRTCLRDLSLPATSDVSSSCRQAAATRGRGGSAL